MKINHKVFQIEHKSEKSGLCFFFPLLMFLFVFVACEDNNTSNNSQPDPDPDPIADTTTSSGVEILDEDDVIDFDKFYKPLEYRSMDFLRGDSKWSFVRSKQSEHFIVFWEPEFGANPNTDSVPQNLRVDIDDLLKKAEEYFNVNVHTLGFAQLGVGRSNLDKYKMQIYLMYQTEWLATGAGYDDVIGALWVNPGTCKPVGATIAHEIGHSFQYQVYADLLAYGGIQNDFARGFRYGFGGNGGNAFWEQCAQWQSFQSYPAEAFTSANFDVYMQNYHRHFDHELQRYASYWMQYYWADKHGKEFLGNLWREAVAPEDPIEAYQRIYGLSLDEVYAEFYDAAAHFVTWDIRGLQELGQAYIGRFESQLYKNKNGAYQVTYGKCPGTTGYNVIPLNVPEAGTVITTSFNGLAPGSVLAADDPGTYIDNEVTFTTTTYNNTENVSGWRYGYVALLNDGQRVYGEMNQGASSNVDFTVPEGCQKLWFVVLGAPSVYHSHAWDDKESNDDQWPYELRFTNTDLLGNTYIDPNAEPHNLTLTYNVSLKPDNDKYSHESVFLNDNGDVVKIAQALTLQPSEILNVFLEPKETPGEGRISFAAINTDGSITYNTTANGYGCWFDSNGNVIEWGRDNDSKYFAEFVVNSFQFNIGQYPGKLNVGDTCTLKEAMVYQKNDVLYYITFVFNITITAT